MSMACQWFGQDECFQLAQLKRTKQFFDIQHYFSWPNQWEPIIGGQIVCK